MESKRINLALSGEKAAPERPAVEVVPDAPLEERVLAALQSVYDPEIPVNIHELGLIYDVAISPDGAVDIKMTLTTPACPVAGALPREVEERVRAVPGVSAARVELVWDPPWDKSRMSDAALLHLGLL